MNNNDQFGIDNRAQLDGGYWWLILLTITTSAVAVITVNWGSPI